jgi:hypothetical protein
VISPDWTWFSGEIKAVRDAISLGERYFQAASALRLYG